MLFLPAVPATQQAAAQQTTQPVGILRDVRIDTKLGGQVPPDLVFRDDTGKQVRLGDYFGRKPILLTLVQYRCPMLCTVVLNEMIGTLKAIPQDIGNEYDVVTVSFDPHESWGLGAAKKVEYVRQYGRPGAEKGWHFLTGQKDQIKALADSVGFRFAYDAEHDQYVHPGGLMVLTPAGRVSRYFYGVDYVARDIRLTLAEAQDNKIAPASQQERAVLYCFRYDPHTGKYSLVVTRALQVAGALTVLAIGTFLVTSHLQERKRNALTRGTAGATAAPGAAVGAAAASRA